MEKQTFSGLASTQETQQSGITVEKFLPPEATFNGTTRELFTKAGTVGQT
jgi:hypothetical protein